MPAKRWQLLYEIEEEGGPLETAFRLGDRAVRKLAWTASATGFPANWYSDDGCDTEHVWDTSGITPESKKKRCGKCADCYEHATGEELQRGYVRRIEHEVDGG